MAAAAARGQQLGNPGFEPGTAAPWTATAGVLGSTSGQTAHGGTWYAWLDGYGTHPHRHPQPDRGDPGRAAARRCRFCLHIDSAETTTTTQFDKLTVKIGTDHAGDVLATSTRPPATCCTRSTSRRFAGQTVTLEFTGTEDSSLQTSFVVDDTALNVS